MSKNAHLISALKRSSISMDRGRPYESIMQSIGDAKVVMIGEASHGTHEFYHHRAELTKRLIEEKGFDFVCVEGDWPDAYRINRYVRGKKGDSLKSAFEGFKRFPTWMWRNTVVRDFAQWLRMHNEKVSDETRKVGFFGLDLYSLHASAHEVIQYLQTVDPEACRRARSRYSMFDHFDDPQSYGMAAAFNLDSNAQEGVLRVLKEMQQREANLLENDGLVETDKAFCARINASVVKDAEEYYRGMFTRKNTWNIRDKHMANTLDDLLQYVGKIRDKATTQADRDEMVSGENPIKAVIWAHNSHLGDAKFTQFSERGERNVGQFVRAKYGLENTYNVGFTSHTGTVTAADEWDDPPRTMQVRIPDSDTFEHLFHQVGGDFVVRFRNNPGTIALTRDELTSLSAIKETRLSERAIGVIYRPKTERISHLFHAQIADQFDAVIHLDKTKALVPVEDQDLEER